MSQVKYMHTINDQPGHYFPGEQVCFATPKRPISPCDSLKQIKQEQQASQKWREKSGFGIGTRLGWVRVKI
jgi:hypothetical protein